MKEPLDLQLEHSRYFGCTAQEKCELIERIWKLEEVVREYRNDYRHGDQCQKQSEEIVYDGPCGSGRFKKCDTRCSTCKAADDILKGRQP